MPSNNLITCNGCCAQQYQYLLHSQENINLPLTFYTVINKKRSSTFVIITRLIFKKCLHCCKQEEDCYTYMKKTCSPHLNNVLTLPCENETSHFILL